MDFETLVELLKNPPEDGLPAELPDQLAAAYQDMVDTYTISSGTLTEQLESANTAREAAETAKKTAQAHNARLLKALPANREPEGGENGNDAGDGPEENPITIESLIEYR